MTGQMVIDLAKWKGKLIKCGLTAGQMSRVATALSASAVTEHLGKRQALRASRWTNSTRLDLPERRDQKNPSTRRGSLAGS